MKRETFFTHLFALLDVLACKYSFEHAVVGSIPAESDHIVIASAEKLVPCSLGAR